MTWTALVNERPVGPIAPKSQEAACSSSSQLPARYAAWTHPARRVGTRLTKGLVIGMLLAPCAWAAAGLDDEYRKLEAAQNTANASPGPRVVPAKVLPVPARVSKELQAAIAAPYPMPWWTANHPSTAQEWEAVTGELARKRLATLPSLCEKLGVTVEQTPLAGVNAYTLSPKDLPPENRRRIVLYIHGGGFVYNVGETGTLEAIIMAAHSGFKVVSIDYRMPPEHPYPAALDDAVAAYKSLLKTHGARRIAVAGTSAGGNLTLALMLRLKAEGLPMPAAIAPGTPWSDLTEEGGGDTMKTNEWVDGTLVSYNGYIRHSAQLYAGSHDLKDPFLSPIYGDFKSFPPAIITSGTRDLFLSLSVLTHRKLRQAGVDAHLQVFEAQSHAQYYVPFAPETDEMYREVGRFFAQRLSR